MPTPRALGAPLASAAGLVLGRGGGGVAQALEAATMVSVMASTWIDMGERPL